MATCKDLLVRTGTQSSVSKELFFIRIVAGWTVGLMRLTRLGRSLFQSAINSPYRNDGYDNNCDPKYSFHKENVDIGQLKFKQECA